MLRVVRVETILDAQQRVAESGVDMPCWAARFRNRQRQLEFELNGIAQAEVDVDVGDLISAPGWAALSQESQVDLPMVVSRSVRIVRNEGRAALRHGGAGEQCHRCQRQRQESRVRSHPKSLTLGPPKPVRTIHLAYPM